MSSPTATLISRLGASWGRSGRDRQGAPAAMAASGRQERAGGPAGGAASRRVIPERLSVPTWWQVVTLQQHTRVTCSARRPAHPPRSGRCPGHAGTDVSPPKSANPQTLLLQVEPLSGKRPARPASRARSGVPPPGPASSQLLLPSSWLQRTRSVGHAGPRRGRRGRGHSRAPRVAMALTCKPCWAV